MNWRRKGPKGCYTTRVGSRLAFLERALPPYHEIFWLLHAPEPGGYVTHTLAAKTREDVFVLAERILTPPVETETSSETPVEGAA